MEIIIMGDMIDSSKMQQPLTQNKFKAHIQNANDKFEKCIKSPLTITLGDEFQGIMKSVKDAVEVLIYLEENLLFENFPYKLRYVINEGEVDTPINIEMAHGMVGSGLKFARDILNSMKKSKTNYYCFLDKMKDFRFYQGFFSTFNLFIKEWSKKKSGDFLEMFIDPKHSEFNKDKYAAEWFGIAASTVWKRKKSLNIEAYLGLKKMLYYYD
jgi:hypothetical protein